MNRHIIAIDPDCEKSGVAVLDTASRDLHTDSVSFPILLDFLKDSKESKPLIIVEAGWLIKSNWHLKKGDNARVASAKGNSTGRNHETGRKIVEMCKHYGLKTIEVKPLKKIWSGPDGKISQAEISQFIPTFPTRSNQEVRDAALIAWIQAGFPIKTSISKPKASKSETNKTKAAPRSAKRPSKVSK